MSFKILIVEDNPVQVESILMFLQQIKVDFDEIKIAANGKKGLEAYQAFLPDIIVTDISMPFMNGVEFAEAIRKLSPSVQILFISAHQDFSYVKSAIDNYAVSYLLKPITYKEFEKQIMHAVEQITKERELALLQSIQTESLSAFRQAFLYHLKFAYKKHIQTHTFPAELLQLNNYRSFMAFTAEINTEDVDSFYCIYDFLKKIKSSLFETIPGTAILESDKRLLCLLYHTSDNAENMLESVIDLLSQITDKLPYNVAIGLSNVGNNIDCTHELIEQSNDALINSGIMVNNSLYCYEKIDDERPTILGNELIETLEQLLDNFSDSFMNRIIEDIFPSENNIVTVKSFCYTFIIAIQNILISRNYNFEDIFGTHPYEKLNRFDSILDPKMWITNILKNTCAYIISSEQRRYIQVINSIKNYIDENYQNIENIEQIISRFYISTSYAKMLFKKYTGETIFDYLFRVRMEAAKKLLSNPKIKIYEIPSLVGYNSRKYFTNIFKKYTGMLPNEYRATHCVQETLSE